MTFERHPLSQAFPDMADDEFNMLVEDIKQNGLRDHGWVYDNMLIDGWHRYKACEKSGVKFRYEVFKGSNPQAFVVSKNERRRHSTGSQRAASIVAVYEWRPRGGNNKKNNDITSNGYQVPIDPKPVAPTTAELAKEARVSESTIKHAKVAHAAGLGEAVRDGALSAKEAAAIATGAIDEPPAKSAPKKKVDKRDERIAELAAKNEALEHEIAQVREGASEAVIQAETAATLLKTDPAKEIIRLKAEIRRLESLRDSLQNEVGQLVRQNKALERKLAKLGQ